MSEPAELETFMSCDEAAELTADDYEVFARNASTDYWRRYYLRQARLMRSARRARGA